VIPIRGARYTSQARPNFDLCTACHAQPAAAAAGPFARAPPPAPRRPPAEVAAAVGEWVWRHFSEGAPPLAPPGHVHVSPRPPLFFQHQGHSRTIVGAERKGGQLNLLLLDPSTRPGELAAALRARRGWEVLVKRGLHTLRQGAFQLVAVEGGLASGAELEGLKVVESENGE